MKIFITLSFLGLPFLASAADWNVVAETIRCHQKVQVKAMEGEDYVIVQEGSLIEKLHSKDGKGFSTDSPESRTFSSSRYEFTQPSVVEANPPKLIIHDHGQKAHCPMVAK